MVSTIMAPALSTIALELDMNSAESVMALSIYLLATAFGPLLIGPLSEIYGRAPILHASNVVCGFAKTKETLIAARFMAGFGASAIYALAGGVLGDIWRPEQRGKSLGVYLLIPLLGAAVGETAMDYVILLNLAVLTIRRSHHRWIHGCTHYLAMVSSS
jgi:MFS family permease